MKNDRLIERLASDFLAEQMLRKANIRTAGEIRHVKDVGPVKRKNIQDHDYSPQDLKALTKILWQLSVALGHLSSAGNQFTRIKSVRISPDGLLGGRGYMKKVTDVRQNLFKSMDLLSGIQDTIYDEVKAPHWLPKVEQLPPDDKEDVREMIEDVEEIRGDPAAYGEEQYQEEIGDEETPDSDLPATEDVGEVPT